MQITMNDSRLINVTQLSEFLKGSHGVKLSLEDAPIKEKYKFIDDVVKRLKYKILKKKEKRLVINYIRKITGYKHTQLFRLVKKAEIGKLIRQLYQRTKARQIQIGITQKPENYGHPGSIRVDSVSQKDVYYINAVDEITQWEIVFCVPQICEACVLPALEEIIDQYPFKIFNFHSDRGGENINYQIASLLQKLLIKQTKSRSYHSNDNALCETKNGSVIRKNMGWEHIDQKFCDKINDYLKNYSNPYLNFHRPSSYPSIETNRRVKEISKIRTNIRET